MKKLKRDPLSLVFFLLMVLLVVYAVDYIKVKSTSENIQVIEATIKKAAIACYAIEGAYPSKLEYLEENYGLQLNEDKYVFEYDIIGSNVMPWIAVVEKGTYYFDNSWS